MATLDDLIAGLPARGLRLANLFQFEVPGTGTWRWQANVTDGEKFWDFGRGSSPVEALEAALNVQSITPGEISRLSNKLGGVFQELSRKKTEDKEVPLIDGPPPI